jgi:hypothetical protein
MECACIDMIHDGDFVDLIYDQKIMAFYPIKCEECHRPVEKEEYIIGKYEYGEQTNYHRTCLDCMSVRDNLFCGFQYSMIWNDLKDNIMEYPDGISFANIAKLTKKAREKVCEIIECLWDEMEDDDG